MDDRNKQERVGTILLPEEFDYLRSRRIGFLTPKDGGSDLYFEIDEPSDLKKDDIVSFQVRHEPYVSRVGAGSRRTHYNAKAIELERIPNDSPVVFHLRCASLKPEHFVPCAQFFLPTLSASEQAEWLKARAKDIGKLGDDAWDAVLDETLREETIRKAAPDRIRYRVLINVAQAVAFATPGWSIEDFDLVISSVRDLLGLRKEADMSSPRHDASRLVSTECKTIVARLIELVREKGEAKQEEISRLQDIDLGQAFGAIEEVKAAAESVVKMFSEAKARCDVFITDLERATVARLVGGRISATFAWQAQVSILIDKHPDLAMQAAGIENSLGVAVAALRFPNVARLATSRGVTSGIVGLVAAIRAYAENRPTLEGSTAFSSLSQEDLILAAHYSGNDDVRRYLEVDNVRGLPGLQAKMDDHPYEQFLAKGVQPRVAELAFASIFKGITGLDENLIDENINALNKGYLPSDDYTSGSRRFDVKSNIFLPYATKINKRKGLRGFYLELENRSDASELAGFVFSKADLLHAEWSFVGFCAERDVDPKTKRAAPFEFALPPHLDFPIWPDVEEEAQLTALLEKFEPASDASHHFSAADRNVLIRSLKARAAHERVDERTLWHEAFEALFEMRCRGGTEEEGSRLLDRCEADATSQFWLHRMALVNKSVLLSSWIDEVLRTVNLYFDLVSCPGCHRNDSFALALRGITNQGTIEGFFDCQCGLNSKATLVTHCKKCSTYPLVIGQNSLCEYCMGLRCMHKDKQETTCSTCKC